MWCRKTCGFWTGFSDDSTASMQKDLKRGSLSEIDGLVYEVVRLGHRLGVPVPNYEEIAESLLLRLKKSVNYSFSFGGYPV